MKSSKIRFNLGRGKNYLKWKVERPGQKTVYIDPNDVQLVLRNCVLKNNQTSSGKIYFLCATIMRCNISKKVRK